MEPGSLPDILKRDWSGVISDISLDTFDSVLNFLPCYLSFILWSLVSHSQNLLVCSPIDNFESESGFAMCPIKLMVIVLSHT
jgi:hypothetical protein